MMLLAVSLTGCASKKNAKEVSADTESLTLPDPISVGTAVVTLEVIEVINEQVSAKIVEVLGYGSTTPNLQPEEEIRLSYHSSLEEKVEAMNSGDVFNAVIAMPRGNFNSSASNSVWRLNEILNNRGK